MTDAPGRLHGRRVDAANLLVLVLTSTAVLLYLLPVVRRPLWYDEQWRAYHVALWKGLYQGLPTDCGPLPYGWLLVEKASTLLLGDSPFAQRLPMALALPALTACTYLLARTWCRPSVSFAVAALLGVNGSIIDYGLQFKPYLLEVLVTVVTVLLWVRARRTRGRTRALYLLGAGAASLFSVPGVLVAGPLLLWEAAQGLRRGATERARLTGALGGGALGLLGLAFLSGQTKVADSNYWREFYLDEHPVSRTWQALGSVLPELLTSSQLRPDNRKGHPFWDSPLFDPVPLWLRVLLGACALGLVVAAAVSMSLRRDDRWGPVGALLTATAGLAVASRLGLWPALWTRVNLFLAPLLLLVLALGAEALLRQARPSARRAWTAALLLPMVLAVGVGVHWMDVLRDTGPTEPLVLSRLDDVGADVRARASDEDRMLLVVNRKAVEVWTPAMRFYLELKHSDDPPFDADRMTAVFRPTDDLASVTASPQGVWIVSFQPDAQHVGFNRQATLLQALGWCQDGPTEVAVTTAVWARFERCPSRA